MSASLSVDYFDKLYAESPDPWQFATSAYERDKYEATLTALRRPHYQRVLEIGCSIGVFTQMLAPRCKTLLAMEPAKVALEHARSRCALYANIEFFQGSIPSDWPKSAEPFDLIVISEVLYYLDRIDVQRLCKRVQDALEDNGEIALVHYILETNYPLTGDEATSFFIEESQSFASLAHQERHARYRLDILGGASHMGSAIQG